MNDVVLFIFSHLPSHQGIARYFHDQIFAISTAKLELVGKNAVIYIGSVMGAFVSELLEFLRTQVRDQERADFKISQVFPYLLKLPLTIIDPHVTGIHKLG